MKFCVKILPALVLGAVSLGVTAGSALAGPRDDVLAALQHCATIPDDQAWLNCYFGAAQPMQAHLAPSTGAPAYGVGAPLAYGIKTPQAYGVGAVRPVAAAPSGPPPMPRYQGGIYSGLFGNGKHPVTNLRMTAYDFDRKGYFTVTLFDGEVWQQLDGDEARAQWNKPASSYVVNVGQGALGTYNLMVNGDGISFKAHRVK